MSAYILKPAPKVHVRAFEPEQRGIDEALPLQVHVEGKIAGRKGELR